MELLDYILCKPKLIRSFGSVLFTIGFFMFIASVWGAMVCGLIGGIPGVHSETTKSLADIYPSLPTFWIPESAIGFISAFLIAAIGCVIAYIGRLIDRQI